MGELIPSGPLHDSIVPETGTGSRAIRSACVKAPDATAHGGAYAAAVLARLMKAETEGAKPELAPGCRPPV
jgi:hypothetical protein